MVFDCLLGLLQGLDASELARRTMELRLVLGECAQIIRFSPYDMLDMGRYFYWHPEYGRVWLVCEKVLRKTF